MRTTIVIAARRAASMEENRRFVSPAPRCDANGHHERRACACSMGADEAAGDRALVCAPDGYHAPGRFASRDARQDGRAGVRFDARAADARGEMR